MGLLVGSNASAKNKAMSSNYGGSSGSPSSSSTPKTTTSSSPSSSPPKTASAPTTSSSGTSYTDGSKILSSSQYATLKSLNPSMAASYKPISAGSSAPTKTTSQSQGGSPSGYYRDSAGNAVDASGKILVTASTIARLDPEAKAKMDQYPLLGSSQPQITEPQKEQPKPNQVQPQQNSPIGQGDAIFLDDFSLINYNGQYFVVDKRDGVIRPFASTAAFNNAFDDPEAAKANALVVDGTAFMEGGVFEGFPKISNEYAIQSNGSFKRYDGKNLQARYGKQVDTALEQSAYMTIDGFIDILAAEGGGISKTTIDKIRNDKEAIAKYINALSYGGYTLDDIYRDMKKKDLGTPDLEGVDPISTSQDRLTYQGTAEGKIASTMPQLNPPARLKGIDQNTMNLPLYQIPDEAFKTLIPILDYNSEAFKAAADKVESAYYDVLQQQLSAKTEQEKAVADYNYAKFKEEVAKSYGITLSDNAYDAWNQIQQAKDSYSKAGISGSGLEQESIDNYLRGVRKSNDRLREERLTKEESQKAEYFLKYATPAQIKDLVASDPEKAKAWGLIPPDDVKAALSFDALKAKYPKLSDQEIMDYASSIIDENGNYRSSLYQQYASDAIANRQAKQTYQQNVALQQSLAAEEKAYLQYTTPDSPFLRTPPPGGDTGSGTVKDLDLPAFSSVGNTEQTGNFAKDVIKNQKEAPAAKPSAPATGTYTAPNGSTISAANYQTLLKNSPSLAATYKPSGTATGKSVTLPVTGNISTKPSTSSTSKTPTSPAKTSTTTKPVYTSYNSTSGGSSIQLTEAQKNKLKGTAIGNKLF